MKNNVLLLIPAFLLASCAGQNINRNVLTEVRYDAAGNVESTFEYTYKDGDLLTMKETSGDNVSLLSETYNSKGLLVESKIQELKNGNYVDKYLYITTYDNHDVMLSTEDYVLDEETNKYELSCLTLYEFDAEGRETRLRSISYDDDLSVVMQLESTKEYNSLGMISKIDEYFYDLSAGEMTYFSGSRYQYEADNKTLAKETTLDSDGNPMMISVMHNNEDKTVREIVTTKIEDGEEKPFKVQTFEYNANKDQTMQKSVYSVNGFGDEVIRWEYDKENRMTKKSFFDLMGNTETLDAYYTYSY